MREWSLRRILWTSGFIQAAYMLLVSFTSSPIPVNSDVLLVGSGVIGGLLTGVFLSRLRIGDFWSNGANFWDNAAGYGAVAAILGTVCYFALLTGYNLVATWQANGVFAPQIVLSVEFVAFLFHSAVSFLGGFVGGIAGLAVGNFVDDVMPDRRHT